MNPNQYGFKSGHSTEAVLAKVINKIQKNKKQGGHTIGVFLDIQGAFDNLPHSAIQKALEKVAGRGKVTNWITNMVKTRDITLTHGLDQVTRRAPKELKAVHKGEFSPLSSGTWFSTVYSKNSKSTKI